MFESTFGCDVSFGPSATQEEVFERAVQPTVDAALRGYNGAVIAYGQTGSGKTHTMVGNPQGPLQGMAPRAVSAIFEALQERPGGSVEVSVLEIYNERVRDLLATSPGVTTVDVHEVKCNLPGMGAARFRCPEATTRTVSTTSEAMQALMEGMRKRETATTEMNHCSSRSHLIFTVSISQTDPDAHATLRSRLHMVDLAGSERLKRISCVDNPNAGRLTDRRQSVPGHSSGAIPNRRTPQAQRKETGGINKSLLHLALVIQRLSTPGMCQYVPYRDSMLTRLLADSFGGNSKTCLIITCSPDADNRDETRSSLEFGKRAKLVKNRPEINLEVECQPSDKTSEVLQAMVASEVAKLREENEILQARHDKLLAAHMALRAQHDEATQIADHRLNLLRQMEGSTKSFVDRINDAHKAELAEKTRHDALQVHYEHALALIEKQSGKVRLLEEEQHTFGGQCEASVSQAQATIAEEAAQNAALAAQVAEYAHESSALLRENKELRSESAAMHQQHGDAMRAAEDQWLQQVQKIEEDARVQERRRAAAVRAREAGREAQNSAAGRAREAALEAKVSELHSERLALKRKAHEAKVSLSENVARSSDEMRQCKELQQEVQVERQTWLETQASIESDAAEEVASLQAALRNAEQAKEQELNELHLRHRQVLSSHANEFREAQATACEAKQALLMAQSDFQSQKERNTTDAAALGAELAILRGREEENRKIMSQSQEEQRELHRRLAAATAAAAAATESLRTSENEVATLQGSVKDIHVKASEAERNRRALHDHFHNQRSEMERTWEQRVVEKTKKVDECESKISALHAALHSSSLKAAQETQLLRQTHEATCARLDEETTSLQRRMREEICRLEEDASMQKLRLQEENTAAHRKLSDASSLCSQLEEEKAALLKQKKDDQAELDRTWQTRLLKSREESSLLVEALEEEKTVLHTKLRADLAAAEEAHATALVDVEREKGKRTLIVEAFEQERVALHRRWQEDVSRLEEAKVTAISDVEEERGVLRSRLQEALEEVLRLRDGQRSLEVEVENERASWTVTAEADKVAQRKHYEEELAQVLEESALRLSKLEVERSGSDDKWQGLVDKLAQEQSEFERVRDGLRKRQEEVDRLEGKLVVLTARSRELEADRERTEFQLESAEQSFRQELAENSAHKAHQDHTENDRREKLSIVTQELEAWQLRAGQLDSELNAFYLDSDKTARLQREIDDQAAGALNLQRQLEAASQRSETQQSMLESLEEQVAALQDQIRHERVSYDERSACVQAQLHVTTDQLRSAEDIAAQNGAMSDSLLASNAEARLSHLRHLLALTAVSNDGSVTVARLQEFLQESSSQPVTSEAQLQTMTAETEMLQEHLLAQRELECYVVNKHPRLRQELHERESQLAGSEASMLKLERSIADLRKKTLTEESRAQSSTPISAARANVVKPKQLAPAEEAETGIDPVFAAIMAKRRAISEGASGTVFYNMADDESDNEGRDNEGREEESPRSARSPR